MLAIATRMHADRKRLGERGVLGRKPVRHFEQQRLAEQHLLGIAAEIIVGIADALRALRRQQRRQRAHFRPGLQLARRVRAVVEDLAAELMAEHDVARQIHRRATGQELAQLHHAVGMLACVQIGTADAAGERFDQHLAGAGLRLGHPVDDHLAVPEDRCAHIPSRVGFVPLILMRISSREMLSRIKSGTSFRRRRL
ncbi:hypothetical protein ACVIHF_001312 [Bradyrhizobium sp. USDA 4506]